MSLWVDMEILVSRMTLQQKSKQVRVLELRIWTISIFALLFLKFQLSSATEEYGSTELYSKFGTSWRLPLSLISEQIPNILDTHWRILDTPAPLKTIPSLLFLKKIPLKKPYHGQFNFRDFSMELNKMIRLPDGLFLDQYLSGLTGWMTLNQIISVQGQRFW